MPTWPPNYIWSYGHLALWSYMAIWQDGLRATWPYDNENGPAALLLSSPRRPPLSSPFRLARESGHEEISSCRYEIPTDSRQVTEEISQVKMGPPKWEMQHRVAKGSLVVHAPPHPRFQCCGLHRAINLRYFGCSHALVVLIKTLLMSTLKLGARGFYDIGTQLPNVF